MVGVEKACEVYGSSSLGRLLVVLIPTRLVFTSIGMASSLLRWLPARCFWFIFDRFYVVLMKMVSFGPVRPRPSSFVSAIV